MLRLVESSDPDGVARHNTRVHYTQRLVLTASVCRELQNSRADRIIGRPEAALDVLSRWMKSVYDLPADRDVDYSHGLDHPLLEQFANDLKPELEAGARACRALMMAFTADKSWEYDSDIKTVRARLADYWAIVDADSA